MAEASGCASSAALSASAAPKAAGRAATRLTAPNTPPWVTSGTSRADRQPRARRGALQAPYLFDRRAQLTPEARWQRRALQRSCAAEQDQSADGPSGRAERDLENVSRRRAGQQVARQVSGSRGGGDRRGVRRVEDQRATGGPGQRDEPPERTREPFLEQGAGGQRGQQGRERARRHGGVRTFPGRLPVCSPCLTTKRPFTTTCSMPSG